MNVMVLSCPKCKTEILGAFNLPVLARLTEEEQIFIVEFVKRNGNLKEMAEFRKVSFPTFKNYYNELVKKLNILDKKSSQKEP